MHSVLITYAPDTAENRKTVDLVRGAFAALHHRVSVKKALDSHIPDIADSDLVIFGMQKTSTGEPHADFAELARAFKGVNLAGRAAGFFSFGTEKATSRMRRMLKDSDISQSEDDPAFPEKGPKPTEIEDWVKKVSQFLQAVKDARR